MKDETKDKQKQDFPDWLGCEDCKYNQGKPGWPERGQVSSL